MIKQIGLKSLFTLMLSWAILFIPSEVLSQDFIWNKSIGSTGKDRSKSIAEDSKGNVIISGSFSGTVDFDPSGTHSGGIDIVTANSGKFNGYLASYKKDGSFNWVRAFTGNGSLEMSNLAIDANDNIVIVGGYNTGATINFDPLNFQPTAVAGSTGSSYNIFVAKYNSSGAFQWLNAIGQNNQQDAALDVKIDLLDNIFVTGYFTGTANFNPRSTNNMTITSSGKGFYIVKYNTNGIGKSIINNSNAGYNNQGRGLAIDQIGRVYAVGVIKNEMVIHRYDNKLDNLLLSIEADAGSGADLAYSIALDPSYNIYVGGSYTGNIEFYKPNNFTSNTHLNSTGSYRSGFLVKYNSSGIVQWFQNIGNPGNHDLVTSISINSSNQLYAVGLISSSSVDFNNNNSIQYLVSTSGGYDSYLYKFTDQGGFDWVNKIGGSGHDITERVKIESSENLFISGYYASSNVDFDPGAGTSLSSSNGNYDIFLTKFSPCQFKITSHPTNVLGLTITPGTTAPTATFSVSHTGSGLFYQWQRRDGFNTFSDIPGANSSTYTTAPVTHSLDRNEYRVKIYNSSGCYIFSEPALLTIDCGFNTLQTLWSMDNVGDPMAHDWFGVSTAMDNNFIVIGSCEEQEDENNTNRITDPNNTNFGGPGAAYVYARTSNGKGVFFQKLTSGNDRDAWDFFGVDVDISGDFIVVGALKEDAQGINAGAAYVYYKCPTCNQFSFQQRITAPMASYSAGIDTSFGSSVSISGNKLIIGAPGFGTGGKVFTYLLDPSTNTFVNNGVIESPIIEPAANFGAAVSISDNDLLIGEPNKSENGISNVGEAHFYQFNSSSWVHKNTFELTNHSGAISPRADAVFGSSVDVNGKWAIVGAPLDEGIPASPKAGSVQIFEKEPVSGWQHVKYLQSQYRTIYAAGGGYHFGKSVAINSKYAVIGKVRDHLDAHNLNIWNATGSVEIYQTNANNTFPFYQKLQGAPRYYAQGLGWSVSVHNEFIAAGGVGAKRAHYNTNENGYVALYEGCEGGGIVPIAADPRGQQNLSESSSIPQGIFQGNVSSNTEIWKDNNKIILGPNPTSSKIRVEFVGRAKSNCTIYVYDMDGSEVISSVIVKQGDRYSDIDLSLKSTGLYYVKIIDNKGEFGTYKIIKQ